MILWPSNKNGLIISIINRTDLIDSIGLQKGDIREIVQITLQGTSLLNNIPVPKKFKIKILFIGTLEDCKQQFSEYATPAQLKLFRNTNFY